MDNTVVLSVSNDLKDILNKYNINIDTNRLQTLNDELTRFYLKKQKERKQDQRLKFLKAFLNEYCDIDSNKLTGLQLTELLNKCIHSIKQYKKGRDTQAREILMDDIALFLTGKRWPTYCNTQEETNEFMKQLSQYTHH